MEKASPFNEKVFKTFNCPLCGEFVDMRHTDEVNEKLTQKQMCFTCNFWTEQAEYDKVRKDENRGIPFMYEGRHYVAAPLVDLSKRVGTLGIGSGGIKMTMTRADGSTFTSNNVWHQGEVPERFRDLFNDPILNVVTLH